mgnify:CR=1 FL=1
MKKYYILAVVFVLALFIAIYLETSKTSDISGQENIIFFYGKECPHCQIVEEYIEKSGIDQKVEFTRAEIYHNKNNQKIFIEKNKSCGINDEKKMGVPFLWADGKCMSGQDNVIEYFQNKVK